MTLGMGIPDKNGEGFRIGAAGEFEGQGWTFWGHGEKLVREFEGQGGELKREFWGTKMEVKFGRQGRKLEEGKSGGQGWGF